ncbi:MAG: radical SAM protein [Candidatus Omnitrophica bacterium]|nr:radical SAM protein [Candidatus Omnitrophota bacterium]
MDNAIIARGNKLKRAVVVVGFACNNNCRFCVTAGKRVFGDKGTIQVKGEIEDAFAKGAREIVLTGGECTIRGDIIDIVSFARERGFLIIQVQTNGRSFSDVEFCKRIIRAGMNEFAPALHGHTAELHDFLTRRKGSFRQTVLGINNIRKLTKSRLNILTNTVITKYNYRFLPEIASLLIKLRVHQYQFAFVHAMGNALKNFKQVVPRKTDVMPYVKEGLDKGLKMNVRVMAEAIPLCLMQGFEQCVSEFRMPSTDIWEKGYKVNNFEFVRKYEAKTRFGQCKRCIRFSVCEGPWKEYPQFYGSKEFKPILN